VTDESPSLRLLVNVMMYIGSCYRDSVTPPHNLRESVYSFDWAVDGFTVQSTMLMSLAASMCDDDDEAEKLFALSLSQARLIGMDQKSFADAKADSDPVLAESWRRTWWMVYLVDANYCFIRRDYRMAISSTESHVDLPCEDDEYSSLVSTIIACFKKTCHAHPENPGNTHQSLVHVGIPMS
jgi:hypothetical protein